MSALAVPARTPQEQQAHDASLAALTAAFLRLPERRRARCRAPVTGDGATDVLVLAEAGDGSGSYEGVIVDGEQDEDGCWVLDALFAIFTTDDRPEGGFVLVHGWNCDVQPL